MKIKDIYEKEGIVVLENIYSPAEYNTILQELQLLNEFNLFLPPEQTASAINEDGSMRKKNSALFLDSFYRNVGRENSNILRINRDKILNDEIFNVYSEINPMCSLIFNVNFYSTLVSYYENEDLYDSHRDNCVFTILSYVYKEPKGFSGGDLIINVDKENIYIPLQKNICIIFPSVYDHSVTTVRMTENQPPSSGRFCISQFLYINGNLY